MKSLKYLFDDTANKLAICFFTLVNSYYVFFKLTYNLHMREVGLYVSISLGIQFLYTLCGVIFAQEKENKIIYLTAMILPVLLSFWYVPLALKGM